MFTGIVEVMGEIVGVEMDGTNKIFQIASDISHKLKIDQSVAHDGVCLTVTAQDTTTHTVVAVQETLERSSLDGWQLGSKVNLERAMKMDARLDGHMVQGHVDEIGVCEKIEERDGSWMFFFSFPRESSSLIVNKGSICVNGVSLTVVNPTDTSFSVSIIPYTFEHTGFGKLREGDTVNIEYDIIGKYVQRMMAVHQS